MHDMYYENALRIGVLTAEWLGKDQLPLTPDQVVHHIEKMGLEVIIIPLNCEKANPKVRAIYDNRTQSIVIQKASLVSLKKACNEAGLGPIGYKDVLAMHLAHELFHHLEHIGTVPFSSYYSMNHSIGCGARYGLLQAFRNIIARLYSGPPLVMLREIAAHSFVTTLLGLSVSPTDIEKIRIW